MGVRRAVGFDPGSESSQGESEEAEREGEAIGCPAGPGGPWPGKVEKDVVEGEERPGGQQEEGGDGFGGGLVAGALSVGPEHSEDREREWKDEEEEPSGNGGEVVILQRGLVERLDGDGGERDGEQGEPGPPVSGGDGDEGDDGKDESDFLVEFD